MLHYLHFNLETALLYTYAEGAINYYSQSVKVLRLAQDEKGLC